MKREHLKPITRQNVSDLYKSGTSQKGNKPTGLKSLGSPGKPTSLNVPRRKQCGNTWKSPRRFTCGHHRHRHDGRKNNYKIQGRNRSKRAKCFEMKHSQTTKRLEHALDTDQSRRRCQEKRTRESLKRQRTVCIRSSRSQDRYFHSLKAKRKKPQSVTKRGKRLEASSWETGEESKWANVEKPVTY